MYFSFVKHDDGVKKMMFLKERSISSLICVSRSYSAMIELFYNSVNFHFTVRLTTLWSCRLWWQLFTVRLVYQVFCNWS